MSFAQLAVTADKGADAEILAAIDAIEFDFGQNRFTTAQAELLFTCETGFDLDRLYVVALSKNCGTVIFYIPDDLTGRIIARASELHCSARKYLADLVEFRQAIGTIIESVAVAGIGAYETVCAIRMLAQAGDRITHNAAEASSFRRMEKAVRTAYIPDVRKSKSNNWLKMHGFPMRRRGKE